MQIYVGGSILKIPENNGGYTGTPFLSSDNELGGLAPALWQLDDFLNTTPLNGDVTVLLQSSICVPKVSAAAARAT